MDGLYIKDEENHVHNSEADVEEPSVDIRQSCKYVQVLENMSVNDKRQEPVNERKGGDEVALK